LRSLPAGQHRALFAQSDLPAETQAKLLDVRIAEAFQSKDNQALIGYIEQYRKLGARFPLSLLVNEAQAARALGDSKRGTRRPD
jgi:hypothetical protein